MLFRKKNPRSGKSKPCPCGSGKSFKDCCGVVQRFDILKREYMRRYKIRLKDAEQIEGIRKAGVLAVDLLDAVGDFIRPGVTTDEINTLVHTMTLDHGAVPAPLNYRGFPKSVCVSVNQEVCHGIPGPRVLKEGDIANVDVTPILEGYYADTNKTFAVGEVGPEARRIMDVTRECLRLGMREVGPGKNISDIGRAIQRYAEVRRCGVVREMVGHGTGLEFHEAPEVPHYDRGGQGVPLVPGMVFCIEPMINLGGHEITILDDKWTVVTKDGSLSAQYEQTVLVTEDGFESLTPYPL